MIGRSVVGELIVFGCDLYVRSEAAGSLLLKMYVQLKNMQLFAGWVHKCSTLVCIHQSIDCHAGVAATVCETCCCEESWEVGSCEVASWL